MKILLVNPWIEDFAAYDFWLKPVGLLYVGSFLKKLGFEVHLIDLMNRYEENLENYIHVPRDKYYGTGKFPHTKIEKPEILKFVPRQYKRYGAPVEFLEKRISEIGKVDAVFVTSTLTYWYPGYYDTIKEVKSLTNAPVFLGGFYARNLPWHAQNSGAIVFPTNNLNRLPKFLSRYLDVDVPEIDFDWFRDLSPAYELYKRVGYVVLLTTLGCPYKCTYCVAHRNWERMVFKDPLKVIEEIEKFGELLKIEDFVFFDDAILINYRDHFRIILLEIIRRGLNKKYRFHLPNGIHAGLLNEEIANLLFEANFKVIRLGYETKGKLQELTGGKVRDEDLIRAAKLLTDAGFTNKEVGAYVMMNLPGQTVQEVLDAVDVCLDAGIDVSVNEFTPIVGSDIWMELVNSGKLSGLEDPLLLNNTIMPYWWKNMTVDEIEYIKRVVKEKRMNYVKT